MAVWLGASQQKPQQVRQELCLQQLDGVLDDQEPRHDGHSAAKGGQEGSAEHGLPSAHTTMHAWGL